MTKSLRIGYVPLTDAALLHVAKAQNFAAARGVEIELAADSSWANIRAAPAWSPSMFVARLRPKAPISR